jgi:pretoxin HINT domain-containing protein/ParB-like nuclease family protein
MFETTISLDALAESLASTGLPVEVLLPEADGELVGHINILQASRDDRSIILHPQGLGPLLCELMRKDTSKQPKFIDRRLPTFDELKQRPGFARYMESGTYDEAIADWVKGICASAIPEDDAFCSVTKSYGLLEKDPGVVKFMRAVSVAVVLAPLVIECVASELCSAIAGGVANATTPEGAAFVGASGAVGAGNLLDDAIDLGRAACSFTGDTNVLMADGTHKPIGDIKSGDEVFAADPKTGSRSPRRVIALVEHQDTVVDLITESGSRITTTEDHPFWNATDGTWERADQLDSGDALLTAAGNTIRVAGLDLTSKRSAEAYNLSIDDIHTYHVLAGETPVLVHNICGIANPFSFRRTEALSGNASRRNVDSLAASMAEDGWQGDPISVARIGNDLYILDGHHRVAAAKRAGIDVPYRVLSDAEIRVRYRGGVDEIVADWAEVGPDRLVTKYGKRGYR